MASTILVRQLIADMSAHLVDTNPQFKHWTQDEMIGYLNDAQRAIAKYIVHACSRVDAVKLRAGTKQSIEHIPETDVIPGNGSTPEVVNGTFLQSIVRNMGADGATPGRPIRVVDRDILDTSNPDWHNKSGTPTQYTFDPAAPKIFYVSPGVASGANVWVELCYLSDPVQIPLAGDYSKDGSNSTVISVDDKYADDLKNYMLARAYTKESQFAANAQLASYHAGNFVTSLNAQATALTGVNPNLQTLPLNPNSIATAK